jgi:hypothetical protein
MVGWISAPIFVDDRGIKHRASALRINRGDRLVVSGACPSDVKPNAGSELLPKATVGVQTVARIVCSGAKFRWFAQGIGGTGQNPDPVVPPSK